MCVCVIFVVIATVFCPAIDGQSVMKGRVPCVPWNYSQYRKGRLCCFQDWFVHSEKAKVER